MRKILEDFYFGNITPSVRIMTPNSKLRRMVNNVTRCENQLKEQLSEPEQALLTEEFKLLADFNGSVLAGQETKYGVQMVTWDWTYNKTGVTQGHYYGPGGTDSYTAAKQDFAVRSGLVRDGALFAPEQLTEIYRSIHETLDSEYHITEERRKLLESAVEQIERTVPNLAQRVEQSNQKELDLEPPDASGMSFC